MSGKAKTYTPKSFEAVGVAFKGINGALQQDTFAAIFESMLQSDAYKDLTPKQQSLYTYCKSQFVGKRKPEKDFKDIPAMQGTDKFYFNISVAMQYGLYQESTKSNFYKDMTALIEHGFIERVVSGKLHRTKTVYKYSNKWQIWKPPKQAAGQDNSS